MNDRVGTYLGLSMRMGKCVSGHSACRDALEKRKAALMLLDASASERTKEQFMALGERMGIPVRVMPTQQQIGKSIGKGERVLVAVTDKQMAQVILGELQTDESNKEVEA